MSARRDRSSSPSPDERRAAKLLELGRIPPRRPVDLLLEDLATHGPGRLEELLDSGPTRRLLGRPLQALAGGGASLAELAEAKNRCKATPQRGMRERLEHLAGYFTAVAAALVHHRTRITTRTREDLEPVLLDLPASTVSPWSELFGRASSVAADDQR